MTSPSAEPVRSYESIVLTRKERLLTITLNRPESLNAVNLQMHEELADVFGFAASDPHSDVIVLTGAGRAFSAGGDLDHIAHNAAHPHLFDHEVRVAKRIVFAMLDLDKPLICRMNGHAVGLGATLEEAVERLATATPTPSTFSIRRSRRRWSSSRTA